MSKKTFRFLFFPLLAVCCLLSAVIAVRPFYKTGTAPPTPDESRAVSIPVLCYHQTYEGTKTFGGYNVQPAVFEAQLQSLIEKGYRTITLRQMEDALAGRFSADFPERPILLTFDDGLTSQADVVSPLLAKYGMTGVLFLYPSIIETKNAYYMRWDRVREVLKNGVLEVGSHTLTHPKLPLAGRAEIRRQLVESKRILEEKLGVQIRALAYPFGLYDARVIEEARAAGYTMAFTIHPGRNERHTNPFLLQRFMLMTEHSLQTLHHYLELPAPARIRIHPEDGSYIQPAGELRIEAADFQRVRVQLGSRPIALNGTGHGSLGGRFPAYRTKTGLLYLTVYAHDVSGRAVQRQLLYLDRALHLPRD
ncbi:MAG: polysaccharide deacetylase family protein [Spirochaetales bacterium]|nr:polysaccharide deacetylase family protein [Spirochaetales bacterium]